MEVAGELAAAGADAAGADRFLGVADAASPLHQLTSANKKNLKALPRRTQRSTEEIKAEDLLVNPKKIQGLLRFSSVSSVVSFCYDSQL
jgi:hypothetical protein